MQVKAEEETTVEESELDAPVELHGHVSGCNNYTPMDCCPALSVQKTKCVLRSYIRQRDSLIKSASTHVQRMQKALIQMNLHLHKVVSDITGLTGMAITRAIVAGEPHPQTLATLKHPRIKSSTTEIAHALTDDYRNEHLFVLKQKLTLYNVYQKKLSS